MNERQIENFRRYTLPMYQTYNRPDKPKDHLKNLIEAKNQLLKELRFINTQIVEAQNTI